MALAFRLMAVAAVAVIIRFFLTGVGVPIARWHYFAAAFVAIGLIAARTALAAAPRRRALTTMGAFTLGMIGTVGLPWTSRDWFLIDFQRVQRGMTRDEANTAMQKYMRGTGIENPPGVHTVHAGSRSFPNDVESAMLTPQSCEVYRHSNEGLWNADWGIVCYESGRVVSTDFSAD